MVNDNIKEFNFKPVSQEKLNLFLQGYNIINTKKSLTIFSKLINIGLFKNNDNLIAIASYNINKSPGSNRSLFLKMELYIALIIILNEKRQMGYGTLMLDRIENENKNNTLQNISLHVSVNNSAAIRFYKKHGFSIDLKTKNTSLESPDKPLYYYRMTKQVMN